jgi:hypothetical protein
MECLAWGGVSFRGGIKNHADLDIQSRVKGLVKVTRDDDDYSRGQVQLVVLINFEEDVHHRKE